MKKFLIFMASILGLVACKNNIGNEPNAVLTNQNMVFHAKVNNLNNPGGTPQRIHPKDPNSATVYFEWDDNDIVILKTSQDLFCTLKVVNIIGDEAADFVGTISGDITCYHVYYGYDPSKSIQTLEYIENSFKPCVYGEGANDKFQLDHFFPVIKLQLKGDETITIGKIEYLIDNNVVATMPINECITLTSETQIVYLPINSVSSNGFTIKLYDNNDHLITEKTASINLTEKMGKIITMPELIIKEPQPINLGLSVKWANMNIGAATSEDRGILVQWGKNYSVKTAAWSSYESFCNGNGHSLTKYNTNDDYGIIDNITTLESIDDVAYVNWGNKWRIPTYAEINELINDCDWVRCTEPEGYLVKSKINSNFIFLPATGFQIGTAWGARQNGFYWSASLSDERPDHAYRLFFNNSEIRSDSTQRCAGYAIRAVYSN